MSGAASTLSNAKPLVDPAKTKPDPAVREKTGPKLGDALKSLGTAVARKIRGEGVNAFSTNEKKQWWKEKGKFKIGLVKTSRLDKVIDIYGETFDLSKRLTKEERKVFKDSCHYEDGDDVKEELEGANYEKAKTYGMNLLNSTGKPDTPQLVETSGVMTTTDFEKLYLGWLYDPVKLANSVAAAASLLPTAPVAEDVDGKPVAAAVVDDKKKLKVEVLKGLFRFVFGTAKINKVTSGLEKYRAAYTDFDLEEKIPCKGDPLWADFKKSLEYRREQAICELHSAKVVIGTDFNQYVEQKTALCVGLTDLIRILENSPCFIYDGTEHPVDQESGFTDEDYQRALRVFNNFISSKKAGKANSKKLRDALAGLRKPGSEPTPYGELYDMLVEALESLTNPEDKRNLDALRAENPRLLKENEDLRNVVDLLTKRLNHSKVMADLLLKASTLYTSKLCGKAERNDDLQAEYDDLLEELEGAREEARQGAAELARLIVAMGAMRNAAQGALEAQRMLDECVRVQDQLVQVITRVEEAVGTAPPDDLVNLNRLLDAAKAEYGTMEEKRAALSALIAGLEGRDARIAVPGVGPAPPSDNLRRALAATTAVTAERDAATGARNAAAAERDAAALARNAAAAERDAAARDRDAASADAAAARAAAAVADAAAVAAAARAADAEARVGGDAAAREQAATALAASTTALEAARTEAAASVAAAAEARAAVTAAEAARNAATANAATARGERNTAAADAAVARREAEADRAAKAAADAATAAAEARAEAAVAGAGEAVTRAAEAAAEAARLREASAAADAAAAAARDDAAAARAETAAARAETNRATAAADARAAEAERAANTRVDEAAAATRDSNARAAAANARAAAATAATAAADERAAAANTRAAAATAAIEAADARAAAANVRAAAATAAIDASTADATARVDAAEARAAAIEAAGGDAAAAIAAANAATRAAEAEAVAARAAAAAATADADGAKARAKAAEDAAATTAADAAAAAAEAAQAAAMKAATDAAAIADLTRNRNASAAQIAAAEAAAVEARAAIAAASAEAASAREAAANAAVAERESIAALQAAATAAAAANARADEEAEKAAAAADKERAATVRADAAAAAEARATAKGNAAERAAASASAAAIAAATEEANKRIAEANAAVARARGQAADAIAASAQHDQVAREAADAVAAAERQRADAVAAAIVAERERARLEADLARVTREKTAAERRIEGKDANDARIKELTDALAAANRNAAESGIAANRAAAAAAAALADKDRINGLNGTIAAEAEAARAAAAAATADAAAARAAAAATAASAAAEVQTQRGIAAAALLRSNAAGANAAAARAALAAASAAAAERDTAAREAADQARAEAASAAAAATAAAERAAAERAAAARAAERAEAARAEAARAEDARLAAEAEAEAARAEAARAGAGESTGGAGMPTEQQVADAKTEITSTNTVIDSKLGEYSEIDQLNIVKILLNQSQIAISGLATLPVETVNIITGYTNPTNPLKNPDALKEYKDKYLFYIGHLKKEDEIKALEATAKTPQIRYRLSELKDLKQGQSKALQGAYWSQAPITVKDIKGKKTTKREGSVWGDDLPTEIQYIRDVLDNIFEDFSNLLISKGLSPQQIIKELKFDDGVMGSLAGSDLKAFRHGTDVLNLLKTIQRRAIAIATTTHSESSSSGDSTPRAAGGATRKQIGGSRSHEFYKSMLILILLSVADFMDSKEFLAKLKAAMRAAGQEDLVMDLLRRIIDKWLRLEATGYTISFVDFDKQELEGLEEAIHKNEIVLKGDSLHVEAPEEFRDALGDQPYFLVGEGDILHGLDEEVELEAEEKKALAGGIPLTAVLAMYLMGLVGSIGETFNELE